MMNVATWLAIAVLVAGSLAVFIWFVIDLVQSSERSGASGSND